MTSLHWTGLLVVGGLSLMACSPATTSTARTEAPAPTAVPSPADSIAALNARLVREVLRRIEGRERERADSVFSNVQILGAVPARTMLTIMSTGYARALGVGCLHCHVEGDFASDDKRPKRAAREMAGMHRMINDELRRMQNLATPATANRSINCSTCHRGTVDPRAGGDPR